MSLSPTLDTRDTAHSLFILHAHYILGVMNVMYVQSAPLILVCTQKELSYSLYDCTEVITGMYRRDVLLLL